MNVKLRYLAGVHRHKSFGNGQFNPVTDRMTFCHRSLFQAYELAKRRAATSPDTLVSKGRHCHWDELETCVDSSDMEFRKMCTENEPHHDKTNNMICAPSEDSDQPGHTASLIFRCALSG